MCDLSQAISGPPWHEQSHCEQNLQTYVWKTIGALGTNYITSEVVGWLSWLAGLQSEDRRQRFARHSRRTKPSRK